MKAFIVLCLLSINCFLANCSFQTSLFAELNKEYTGKNLIISPFSVFQVLGLTANGAKGQTVQEMIDLLETQNFADMNNMNYELIEALKSFETVEKANAVMTKFSPLKSFLDIAQKYDASVEQLGNVAQVNNWCSEKTHGRIKEILKEINPNTMMLLLNAVYFKGEWKDPFDPEKTYKQTFYNLNKENSAIEVDTMRRSIKRYYYEDASIQAVELPYKKDSMSALIILPKEGIDINEYINSLSVSDGVIREIVERFNLVKVSLTLPKFELDFSGSLSSTLQNMGMKKAFSSDADFSGLTLSAKEGDLYVSDVIQKTYLKVDEFGSEAAAVTVVDIQTKAIQKEVSMKVNRPFIMVIRSEALPLDNDIVFISKIEKLN